MIAAAALVAVRGHALPVLDEETWLWLAAHAPMARPYDWWRPGPPWGDSPAPDAFVFAHPPLFIAWLKLLLPFAHDLADLRRLAGLPWAALLGLGVGLLAERAPRPWPTLALALSAPVVVLALGRGLMPDLMASGLVMAALCAWVLAWEQARRWPVLVAGGLALALAGFTRYPALILAPVLGMEAWRRGRLRESLPFWLAFLLPWAAGEGWLYALYGRVHLWEVLSRAGEIPRGPLPERILGVLVRLGLVVGPAALLAMDRRALPLGFLLGGLALALGWPEGPDTAERLGLLGLAVLGGLALVGAARAREGDRPLLGGLGGVVTLGVALGHNYAASRYLLPGAAPLLLALAGRRRELWIGAAAAAQLGLSLALVRAELAYAEAAVAAAETVLEDADPGSFTGEWSFRWRMEQAGWTFRATPPAEGLVAIPENASPGFGPGEGWEAVAHGGAGLGRLRVLDLAQGVGFYAETLGPLPLGWRPGRLEEVTLWRVR